MLRDHAPAPWKIEDNGHAQGVLIVDTQDKVVAWIPHTEHDDKTVEADALLISIAPKLLADIDTLVQALAEHHNPDTCDNCDTCRLIQGTNSMLNDFR